MPSIVAALSGPEFSFGETCEFTRVDPRRLTVWVQRAHPLKMPVPTGHMLSERKRVFSGLQVLQLSVLSQLVENRTELRTAALVAQNATDHFAHDDKVGAQLDHHSLTSLGDVGLFVEPANGREVQPDSLRQTGLLPLIRSIRETFAEGIAAVTSGEAPKPHTFIPIGCVAQLLIRRIIEGVSSNPEDQMVLK